MPSQPDAQPDAESDPADAAPSTEVVRVAAGGTHACALLASGEVWCWGGNEYGQLGDGTFAGTDSVGIGSLTVNIRPYPAPVVGLSNVIDIALGDHHSCAITDDGSVYCWGRNDQGQLGHSGGDAECSTDQTIERQPGIVACNATPTRVGLPAGVVAKQVGLGWLYTCALSSTGDVYCWGANDAAQLGRPTGASIAVPTKVSSFSTAVAQIAVAEQGNNNCALLVDGTVACWGANLYGGLGHDPAGDLTCSSNLSPGACQPVPMLVRDEQGTALDHVVAVGAPRFGGNLLRTDGSVLCWGLNVHGELADGSTESRYLPRPVTQVIPPSVTTLAWSDNNVWVADTTSNWWGWGRDQYGMVGDGGLGPARLFPVSVPSLSGMKSVRSTATTAIALKGDGTVWLWGWVATGQLGRLAGTNGDKLCSEEPDWCHDLPERLMGLP